MTGRTMANTLYPLKMVLSVTETIKLALDFAMKLCYGVSRSKETPWMNGETQFSIYRCFIACSVCILLVICYDHSSSVVSRNFYCFRLELSCQFHWRCVCTIVNQSAC